MNVHSVVLGLLHGDRRTGLHSEAVLHIFANPVMNVVKN